jgi:hypothetical protein
MVIGPQWPDQSPIALQVTDPSSRQRGRPIGKTTRELWRIAEDHRFASYMAHMFQETRDCPAWAHWAWRETGDKSVRFELDEKYRYIGMVEGSVRFQLRLLDSRYQILQVPNLTGTKSYRYHILLNSDQQFQRSIHTTLIVLLNFAPCKGADSALLVALLAM